MSYFLLRWEGVGVVQRARAYKNAIELFWKCQRLDIRNGKSNSQTGVQILSTTHACFRYIYAMHFHPVRTEQIRKETLSTSNIQNRISFF